MFLYQYDYSAMKKRLLNFDLLRILKHFMFWFGFFGLLFFLSGNHNLSRDFWFVDLPILIVYVYVTAYLILPFFIKRKQYLYLVISFIILSLLLSYLRLKNYDFFYYSIFAPGPLETSGEVSFSALLLNAKDFSFALFVFLAVKYTLNWVKFENYKLEIENTQLESEIELIKTQVDHHFLFNTLNNIYSLSVTDPESTRNAIKKMWGMLDFLVHDIDHEEIRIDKELKLIYDYVELERLRYGDRLAFDLYIDEKLKDYRIPPLIMYPFIENCFKHGSALDPGHPWIKIRIEELDNRIRFMARNSRGDESGEVLHEKEIDTIVKRIRKRLDYYFPGRYKLQTQVKRKEAIVQLDIDI